MRVPTCFAVVPITTKKILKPAQGSAFAGFLFQAIGLVIIGWLRP
jgi:hypothetical protein